MKKKEFNPIEIGNNIIREINCNLLLKNSPIFSLKSGESTEIKTISYNVVINCR